MTIFIDNFLDRLFEYTFFINLFWELLLLKTFFNILYDIVNLKTDSFLYLLIPMSSFIPVLEKIIGQLKKQIYNKSGKKRA